MQGQQHMRRMTISESYRLAVTVSTRWIRPSFRLPFWWPKKPGAITNPLPRHSFPNPRSDSPFRGAIF